ncbi:hypothetical protein [Nonomuraea sp. NPDC050783]|uniref:hypothetical protein n=1 Tax=Nonomuraea sp. NPDC050783 TaxID=3154634 RepID=UPI003465B6DF
MTTTDRWAAAPAQPPAQPSAALPPAQPSAQPPARSGDPAAGAGSPDDLASAGGGTPADAALPSRFPHQAPHQVMPPPVAETVSGDGHQALFGLLTITGVATCLGGAAWLAVRYNPRLAFLLSTRHDGPAPLPGTAATGGPVERQGSGWRWRRPP